MFIKISFNTAYQFDIIMGVDWSTDILRLGSLITMAFISIQAVYT